MAIFDGGAPWGGFATILIYFVSVCAGAISDRILLEGARRRLDLRRSIRTALVFAGTYVPFSMVLWGFASLKWYWPIAAFTLAGIAASGISRRNWLAWYPILPLLNLAAAGCGLYLWVWRWPF